MKTSSSSYEPSDIHTKTTLNVPVHMTTVLVYMGVMNKEVGFSQSP